MLHEEKKIAKIVEELTIFFFGIGANNVSSRIEKRNHIAYITFESDFDSQMAYKLEAMEIFLNGQKNDGMEEIYWELAGSGDPGETSQLLLIGMMVDTAEIIKNDEKVLIKLQKKMSHF